MLTHPPERLKELIQNAVDELVSQGYLIEHIDNWYEHFLSLFPQVESEGLGNIPALLKMYHGLISGIAS